MGIFVIGLLSFIFSFIGSHIFSISELMLIEYKISNSPLHNNLIWDDELIAQKLNDAVIIPEIIIAENNINNQLATHIITGKNRSVFYEKVVLRQAMDIYPINFLIPNKSSFVLFQNNLYIRNFDGNSFEKISPSLGKMLVRNEFGTRSGKDAPFIQILEKEKYQSFRIHQINTRLRELEALIDKLNYAIGLINNDITKARSNISYYKGLADNAYARGDSAYFNCSIAETCTSTYVPGYFGYYYYTSGYFIRNCTPTFPPSYCYSLKVSYYDEGDRYINTSNYWVGEYNDLIAILDEVKSYKERAMFAKATAESSKESIPFELGVFFPENNIKIALSSTESHMASKYISTLVHEYLHYDSNVSEKSLPLFFEEGLTEYFSRKTQKAGLGTDVDLGYPLITSIIERLAEKIPEQDLKDVYYSKDANVLTALLDKNLGEDFFKENEYYFAIIPYVSSQMAIDLANGILEGVGLRKLEMNEIYKINSSIKLN